jgi:hypothetical protein
MLTSVIELYLNFSILWGDEVVSWPSVLSCLCWQLYGNFSLNLCSICVYLTLWSDSLQDEHLINHFVRNNLLKPIVDVFVANGSRYNLLNSAVLELFEFICKVLFFWLYYLWILHASKQFCTDNLLQCRSIWKYW